MTAEQILEIFNIEDLRDLPNAVSSLIDGDAKIRYEAYIKLIEINGGDLSKDWFQEIYEGELSERKQKKQDFTPNSVGLIASLLTGNKGMLYEPTAGNGSMIISDWWTRCGKSNPCRYSPAENMVTCWELSNRSIPILLLNLSIRGIMGYVYHGDVLEQTIKAKYVLLNRSNDALGFSEIIKDVNNNLKIVEI